MNLFDEENPILLNSFLNYLIQIKNYSITTVKEYKIDLLVFFRFIKEYCNIQVEVKDFNIFILANIKESDIIAFLTYLNYTRDCSASTRRRKLSAIKCFYNWLFTHHSIGNLSNPAQLLPSIQNIERLPKCLNLEKAKKLIDIFNSQNSKFPERNNAIISIFLNCGLRASELLNINLCDINLSHKFIKVIGKGNKERTCYINDKTKSRIEKYLEVRNRGKEIIDTSEPLFLSYRNTRLNLGTVEAITKNAYKLAGLEDFGYTTHTLRHTAATIMYKYVKSDILLIKEFLGHSTIKSTEIYTHIDNEDIKRAIESNPLSNFVYERKNEIA